MSSHSETHRKSDYPIQSLILNRWSPRAMSGEELSDEELMPLFEAARWAPSSYNGQPWRFIYGKKNTPEWDPLYSLMVEFNQKWTANAAALILLISHTVFEHNQKPSVTHSFDAGAAWENFALEGSARGLVVHGMQGFDYDKARAICKVPDSWQIEAMIAVGKPGQKESLRSDAQKKESPSSRKPISELIMKGVFQ